MNTLDCVVVIPAGAVELLNYRTQYNILCFPFFREDAIVGRLTFFQILRHLLWWKFYSDWFLNDLKVLNSDSVVTYHYQLSRLPFVQEF